MSLLDFILIKKNFFFYNFLLENKRKRKKYIVNDLYGKKKKKKPWTPSDVNRCFETKPVKLQQATNILKAQNIYQIRIF